MPTQKYMDEDGKRLPGVTWVISKNLGWNKDNLMGWANKEGREGRDIRDRFSTASKAATIGTVAHDMIEYKIHGRDPQLAVQRALETVEGFTKAMAEKARTAYRAYAMWEKGSNIRILGTELWGVSEKWRVGYCIDALMEQDDEAALALYMGDWKSSKGTYADHLIQVASYTNLVEQQLRAGEPFKGGLVVDDERLAAYIGDPDVTIQGAHVIRFDKETAGFSHKFWPREILDEGWKVFGWCRSLHEYNWKLEGYCK